MQKRRKLVISDVILKIARMIAKVNFTNAKQISFKLNISQGKVYHIFSEVLEAMVRIKCQVHQLDMTQIRKNARCLGSVIINSKADTWIYLLLLTRPCFIQMEYGRKTMCYVRNGEERSDKLTFLKHDVFAIVFLTGT